MSVKQLYLHTSNRIESLAERLAQVSRSQPLDSLIAQETVMTLNPGMARWLRFRIAELEGVSFAWEFPFPGALFERLLIGFEPKHQHAGTFDENRARWELFDLLGALETDERFASARRYCETSDSRRLQLAIKLAWLYDQYLLYRPDSIVDWEAGRNSGDWQAELWRRLAQRIFPTNSRPKHIARIWNDLRLASPDSMRIRKGNWPDRISIFGVSSLPPLYLDLLERVSLHLPVHIYLLQPSDLYWADLKTRKQIVKATNRSADPQSTFDLDEDRIAFEVGNPLLPSCGKQGQGFLDAIIDKDPDHDDSAFVEPGLDTQLHCLQSDLLKLEGRFGLETVEYPFPEYDGSIQIHSASTPRREIESLWDYLVDYFATVDQAEAKDVLVMAPDIQDYASHIESVFERETSSGSNIPYSIADQSGIEESAFLSGAIAYLQFASERASATQTIGLLKLPLTREAFDFSEEEIQRIEFWIRESKVVWGWNSNHRQLRDGFPTDRSTWKEFRERIGAGLAYRDDQVLLADRFSPLAEIEGEGARLAGRFADWLNLLESLANDSLREGSVADWNQRLCVFLDQLKPSDEVEERRYFGAIEAIQEALPIDCSVPVAGREVYSNVIQALQSSAPTSGYLSGRVTFCSLKPMRSIPAKAICLLGMNGDRFPRKSIRTPFDLLSRETRRGDRNTRDEDKQFLLETLLSARDRLYFSFQGFSPVSDSEREPSTVLSELIDYLENASPDQSPFPIVVHKRQSYDPDYFAGKELFTYSAVRANHGKAYLGLSDEPKDQPISPESRESSAPLEIDIDSFIGFFRDPQKTFARNALEIAFPRQEETLSESDPLNQDPLARYELRTRLAEAIRSGQSLDSIDIRLIASRKLLPPGHLETLTYETIVSHASNVAKLWQEEGVSSETSSIEIEQAIGETRLKGRLRFNRTNSCRFIVLPGKLTAKNRIDSWIQHLIANTVEPIASRVFSLDHNEPSAELPPSSKALEVLETLVDIFIEGQTNPLPFFPQLSWDALTDLEKRSTDSWISDPLETFASKSARLFRSQRAQTLYQKYPWDSYARSCFGDSPQFDARYARFALRIWQPYRDAIEAAQPEEAIR